MLHSIEPGHVLRMELGSFHESGVRTERGKMVLGPDEVGEIDDRLRDYLRIGRNGAGDEAELIRSERSGAAVTTIGRVIAAACARRWLAVFLRAIRAALCRAAASIA